MKAGIVDGPQIQNMIRDKDFTTSATNIEKRAWLALVDVVSNFLGNRKTENYMESNQLTKRFPPLNGIAVT